MRNLLFVGAACLLASSVHAFDNGQYENMPPDVRQWFKDARSPHGVPCCDVADGKRTYSDTKNGHYRVLINGEMVEVPDEAVITNIGNPVPKYCNTVPGSCETGDGDSVVWYVHNGPDSIYIRCFVPGSGG